MSGKVVGNIKSGLPSFIMPTIAPRDPVTVADDCAAELYITRAKFKLTDALKRSGLHEVIGADNFFSKQIYAMDAIKAKYGDTVDMSHLELHRPKQEEPPEAD